MPTFKELGIDLNKVFPPRVDPTPVGQIDAQEMYDRIQAVVADYDQHARRIREDELRPGAELVTAEGARERIAALNIARGWTEKLTAVEADSDEALQSDADTVARELRKVTTTASGDTQEQLLAETRVGRVWPRIKAKLVEQEDLGRVLDVAAVELLGASDNDRPVMAQELLGYVPERPGLTEELIHQQVFCRVSPKLKHALDSLLKDRKAKAVVDYNRRTAEEWIAQDINRAAGRPPRWVLPSVLGESVGD